MQKNVLEYLEQSAKQYPQKIAFADETKAYTYQEFQTIAKQVAMQICQTIEEIRQPIFVLVDRQVESLIGFMATLYSGNYYVPIDCHMPKQRIEAVMEQVKPKAILCTQKEESFVVELLGDRIHSINTIVIPHCVAEDIPIDESFLQQHWKRVLDVDPVYVIFTSGSTGIPKGIVISQRSVIDFTDWMTDTFHFTSEDCMGNQAPFYFDLSVKDIYTTLKCGATTHIISKKAFLFPTMLVDWINERHITALIWATSAFHLVAQSKVLATKKMETVQKVILGGEALVAKHLNTWKQAMPHIQYVNLYGPTEVTVDCTYYCINRDYADDEAIPIGVACENKEILLLDETHTHEVADGMPGEICVRGTGLAKGYFGDEEKTNQVFIQNPTHARYPDLLYCTGDIAIKNEEGLLVFQSRKDGQIKHMGYRIELGEIERAVNGFEKVVAAICFYDTDRQKIVCVYEGEVTEAEIIAYVQERIPKYMYPNVFRKQEKMPYNANGKIDRVALQREYRNAQGEMK